MSMYALDPTQPLEVSVDDFTGYPGAAVESSVNIGLMPVVQKYSLFAVNPLTEGISVSGNVALSTRDNGGDPAKTLFSKVIDKASVDAQSQHFELFGAVLDGQSTIDVCSLKNMTLHLPAAFLAKDPLSGWSSIALGYSYKAQFALGQDFPTQIPIPVDNLNLPIGQYRVKEVLISTEASSEIPVTFVLESVDVLVNETDEEGNVKQVVCDDVSITPGLTIASGCSGAPVVSPLAIRIKAEEGTIPDIAGLKLNLSVKTPTGDGDKRLNMNQSISFNNLRATVSGGITIQSL